MEPIAKAILSPTKLKSLRVENGWSQEKLAAVSGLSLRTIQRMEKDGHCSVESKLAITAALNIAPAELLTDYTEKVGNGTINYGGIVGALVIVGLCGLVLTWEWKNPEVYINPMNALFICATVFGLSMMSFGFHATYQALATLSWMFKEPDKVTSTQTHLPVLRRSILYCYTAGAFWTLTEVVEFSYFASKDASSFVTISEILFSMQSLLYAVLLAEFILRPLMNRITWLLCRHE